MRRSRRAGPQSCSSSEAMSAGAPSETTPATFGSMARSSGGRSAAGRWPGATAANRARRPPAADASQRYAGFTKNVITPTYLIVINVLPPEQMFTPDEIEALHPVEGEMALRGSSGPIGASSRHVEAHIYSRLTGRPLSEATPSIKLTDHVTGRGHATRTHPHAGPHRRRRRSALRQQRGRRVAP